MQEDFVIENNGDVVIITLNMMRATIKEAQEFKNILNSVIQSNNKKIIINFTQCSFVDSSIIGVIVTSAKELRNNGGDIKGVISEGSMLNMFAQTGLEKIFRHYTSQEIALASFE
jgi:anti-sigma B factor antagonist